ncbi:hypothetical protein M8J76_002329 [Diaphorina citri]|nr:hypothetical protein M8J76_002329 [Diaphorina citri]
MTNIFDGDQYIHYQYVNKVSQVRLSLVPLTPVFRLSNLPPNSCLICPLFPLTPVFRLSNLPPNSCVPSVQSSP